MAPFKVRPLATLLVSPPVPLMTLLMTTSPRTVVWMIPSALPNAISPPLNVSVSPVDRIAPLLIVSFWPVSVTVPFADRP